MDAITNSNKSLDVNKKIEDKVGAIRRIVFYASVVLINFGKTIAAKGGMVLGGHSFSKEFGGSMNQIGEDVDSVLSLSGRAFDLVMIQKKIKLIETKILNHAEDSEELKAELKELKRARVFKTLQEMVGAVKFGLKKGGYQLLKISNKALGGVKGFRGMGLASKIGTGLTSAQIALVVYANLRSAVLLIRDKMVPHYKEVKRVEGLIKAGTDLEKNRMRLQFLKSVGTSAIIADAFKQLLKTGGLGCRVAGFITAVIAGVAMGAVTLSALPFAIMALTLALEIAMHHIGVGSGFGIMEDLGDFATILGMGAMSLSSPLSAAMFAIATVGVVFDLCRAIKSNPHAISDWFALRRAKPEEKQGLEDQIKHRKLVKSLGFASVEEMRQKTTDFNAQDLSDIYGKDASEFAFLNVG